MAKTFNFLHLLYLFLSGKHWIYNEHEVLIETEPKPKPKLKGKGHIVIVIQNKSELTDFLSEHLV